jgi:hypothetical protein
VDVKQNQADTLIARSNETVCSIHGGHDLVAGVIEHDPEHAAHVRVVVYDQDGLAVG